MLSFHTLSFLFLLCTSFFRTIMRSLALYLFGLNLSLELLKGCQNIREIHIAKRINNTPNTSHCLNSGFYHYLTHHQEMAEAVLTDTAASIIKSLESLALQEIGLPWDFKDELEKLGNTVSTIQAVLLDAEEQQAHNHAVKDWLRKLKDAMFEADDLLDDYSTELLRRQVMTRDKKAKQVRIFFSKSNKLAYGFKMGQRVNKVRKTLDDLADDRIKFGFTVPPTATGTRFERRWGEVIGRECETKELVKLLLNFDVNENVSIIPIVGMGGVGKTTLAQHAYNDEEVKRQFDVRLWVCVSDPFDVTSIVAKLIASATKKRPENLEMDLLQSQLRVTIDGKRFLLILDDVQNENSDRWLRLKKLLVGGMRGSKVLITTRSERVAEITGTAPPYHLGSLSVSNSWDLFKKMAFKDGEEPKNPKIIEIGKEIVQMCGHVPLAIRIIGSLLSYIVSEDDWLYVKNVRLYKRQENDILPILKLSYDYLPSGLKQCFAFCSLIPKDCDIYVEVLIQLWIAQGFIQSTGAKCLEDVGREYFMELCYRSFFQDIQRNEYGDIERCKIHDLIHDLAYSVAGEECTISNPYAEKVVEGTRHVAFDSLYSLRDIPTSLLKADRIRTLLLRFPTMQPSRLRYPTRPSHLRFRHRPRHVETVHDTLISSFKSLRALNLSASNIREVPDSIGKLKHLRFLDLSWNFYIELLPTSITKLLNLQTLRLDFCSGLNELPEDTRNLISLRHLGLYDCRSLTHMPHGLGNLTTLQTLTLFTLGKKENSVLNQNVGLGELDSLDELRGELCIKGLEHLRSSPLEAKAANLERKQHLQILGLEWGPEAGDDSDEIISNDEHLLENLRPHLNLKQLIIDGYAGVRLSGWVSSLSKLVSIYISDCKWCQYVPPLDRLPFLKSLVLKNLSALEYISNDGSDVSSSSLESLELDTLPKLRGWWRMSEVVTAEHDSHHHLPSFPSFPFLSSLSIKNCRMMSLIQVVAPGSETTPSSSSPYYDLSKLKSVFLAGLEELESLPEEWLQNLTSLETLNISWCSKLRISMSPLFQHLTALKDLQISNCMELISNEDEKGAECLGPTTLSYLYLENVTSLVSLPGELRHVTTLQWLDIKNCPTLKSLPEWIDQTSLQTLRIQNCSNLISLPEGMHGLTSLRCLTIAGCPDLEKRCKKETGEDWLKIAHVLDFSNQQFYESYGMDL